MNETHKELKSILTRDNEIRFNRSTAGGGFLGLVMLLLCLPVIFALNEAGMYFAMMSVVAISLLLFNVDFQLLDFFRACVNVVLLRKHVTGLASEVIECNEVLDEYEKKYLETGNDKVEADGATIDQNEIARFIKNHSVKKPEIMINTFENRIFNDADEVYASCISVLENVGNLMPLAGLVGTVYGIMVTLGAMSDHSSVAQITNNISVAMETTLYGAVYSIFFKVISSRFKQKREAFEYDFEKLKNHIELLHS